MNASLPGHRRLPPLRPLAVALLLVAAGGCRAPEVPGTGSGVVVERVAAGETVDLLPGDLLLAWELTGRDRDRSLARRGEFLFPWDFELLFIEELPRGPIRLRLLRDGRRRTATLPADLRTLRVRPHLGGETDRRYGAVLADLEAERIEPAVDALRQLARGAAGDEEADLAAWFDYRASRALRRNGRSAEAATLMASRVETVRSVSRDGDRQSGPAAKGLPWLLDEWGRALDGAGAFDEAEDVFAAAVAQRETASAGDLELAHALTHLGLAQCRRGNLEQGLPRLRQALGLRQAAAPGSKEVAMSLNNLGNYESGLATQEEYHLRALEIRQALRPDGEDTAASLNNLGNIAWQMGKLDLARERLEASLAIFERLEPESRYTAGVHGNLALIDTDRGDLAAAERSIRRTLDILGRIEPDGLFYTRGLTILANVVRRRGNSEAAEDYHLQALARLESRAPQSLDVAITLTNLGSTAKDRGDLIAAERFLRRAVLLHQALDPESLAVAISLGNLGTVLEEAGDLEAAGRTLEQSLRLYRREAPGSLRASAALLNLGRLEADRGALGRAEAHLVEALETALRLAPASLWEARARHQLGRLRRLQGRSGEALGQYRAALDALEAQQGRLGGDAETRGRFRSRHLYLYRETIDLLLEQGRDEEAFEVEERSRAQGLLALLAERRLRLDRHLSPELQGEQRQLARDYDRAQGRLADLSPQRQGDDVAALLGEMRAMRRRQRELDARIRQADPRLAALRYPQTLDLERVRAALHGGTTVLSYNVGEETSRLFVVEADSGLTVRTLPVGEQELQSEIRRFLDLLSAGRFEPAGVHFHQELGRRLYSLLVAPAGSALLDAERLLIVPDGPLHSLPFAALSRGDGTYLIEMAPTLIAPSVTAALELAARDTGRPASNSTPMLAAFGDPAQGPQQGRTSSAPAIASPALAAVSRGDTLPPLPASRDEVLAITRLFGDAGRALLGERATEAAAKDLEPGIRYLHFATHGFVDEVRPLDSGLVLTAGSGASSRENGLLQAWEIFSDVRTDAELVVLSACDTARGRELGGEGLIGLTRAFHYAGARSVLASLWSVADTSTSILMHRFYEQLRSGRSPAEALRAAQLELIEGPVLAPRTEPDPGLVRRLLGRLGSANRRRPTAVDARHPFHWAAFQLYGGATDL